MELSIKCCESFNKIMHLFKWFSYQDDNGNTGYVMPYLESNDNKRLRINNCPVCGKNIRNIELK